MDILIISALFPDYWPVLVQLGSLYRSGRVAHWVKVKNPNAPAVKRETEEDWGR